MPHVWPPNLASSKIKYGAATKSLTAEGENQAAGLWVPLNLLHKSTVYPLAALGTGGDHSAGGRAVTMLRYVNPQLAGFQLPFRDNTPNSFRLNKMKGTGDL